MKTVAAWPSVTGICGRGLIINLPGKPSAIADCLNAVFPTVPYCIELIEDARLETDPAVCKAFRPKGRGASLPMPPGRHDHGLLV